MQWRSARRERKRLQRERSEDSPEKSASLRAASEPTMFEEAMDAELRYAQNLLWGVAAPRRRPPGSTGR